MSKRSRKAAARQPVAAPNRREVHRSRREEAQSRRLWTVFGAILGTIAVILGIGAFQQFYLKPRQPIATVNGAQISVTDFQNRALYEKFRLEDRFGPLAAQGTFAQQIAQYVQTELPKAAFETLITDEVLRQEARRQNIAIPDQEVTKAIQAEYSYFPEGTPTPQAGPPTSTPPPSPTVPPGTVVPTPGPTSTAEIVDAQKFKTAYDQFLTGLKTATGLDENYHREMRRSQLLYDRFRQQVIASANIPATTLQVKARQIVVDNEDAAKNVVARLRAGEDFAAVAKEVSTDTATKEQGGDLGYFAQGAKDPVIERAAFSQAVNQISDPIKVGERWTILQVTEAPAQRPIAESDRQSREQQAFDNWLNDLQSKAVIERQELRPEMIPSEITTPQAVRR